jgi:site-specific recombinase XerD
MRLDQAISGFLSGYFSTHERTKKTRAAYSSDLAQVCLFLGGEFDLLSLSGTVVERWAAHLRQEGYAPASSRRKIVVLKVFCEAEPRSRGATPPGADREGDALAPLTRAP